MESASGFNSITLLIAGPVLSISPIRAEYFSTRERAVNFPDFIPSCRAEIVISSSSKGLMVEVSPAAATAGGSVGLADATARAAPSAAYRGVKVAAAPPTRVGRRKERRLPTACASFVWLMVFWINVRDVDRDDSRQ